MNKQIEEIIEEIIEVEKKNIRTRFDTQNGRSVQQARDKADVDAVNDIINLIVKKVQ
jgi:hypothetical protein